MPLGAQVSHAPPDRRTRCTTIARWPCPFGPSPSASVPLDGAPLRAGTLVQFQALADAQAVAEPGEWLLRTTLVRSPHGSDTRWRSRFGTLTVHGQ